MLQRKLALLWRRTVTGIRTTAAVLGESSTEWSGDDCRIAAPASANEAVTSYQSVRMRRPVMSVWCDDHPPRRSPKERPFQTSCDLSALSAQPHMEVDRITCSAGNPAAHHELGLGQLGTARQNHGNGKTPVHTAEGGR